MKILTFIFLLFSTIGYSQGELINLGDEFKPIESGNGLLSGLISVWELDETSGTTVNDSYGSNNGTNTGATVNQSGLIGTSYLFTAGNYLTMSWGGGINPYTTDYTINMWVNETAAGGSDDIIWECGVSTSGSDLYVLKDAGLNWEFGIQSSSAFTKVGTIAVQTGWHMITLVLDSGTASLYVDAVFSASKSYTSFTVANNMYVGKEFGGSFEFDGYIDQFSAHQRALSVNDLLVLYNSGNGLAYSLWTE